MLQNLDIIMNRNKQVFININIDTEGFKFNKQLKE